jgi:WD40 repeat protein
LNTRINGAHDGDINSVSFVVLRNTIGLVTCGNEGKAKLWELGDRAMWTPVRTFSHVGCVPRCVDASHDASVIGVAFDSKITLWSSELLSLLSTLSTTSDESKEDYKDLVFGPGHLLLAANNSAIHVWSLLTNQLTYKMSLSHPKLVKTPKSIIIASSSGVFNLDDKMKMTCLTRKSAHLSSLACSENHCFVVGRTPDKEDNDLFSLAMESSSSNISENGETALERSDATTSQLSLMTSSLSRVKLSRTDDIHAPKLGPTLTASMISAPASKSCLSILKQSLPA